MKLQQLNESISVLLESKEDMLDKSIENADKITDKEAFLKDHYIVEEKIDGTKLNLLRNGEKWNSEDYTKNWVVSYKNQIQYAAEFNSVDREKTKKHSVGISQYALVHDWLKSIHSKTRTIPKNTEFKIEFVQNKLTTTRDYENKHGLYLISYSPAIGEIEGGMLKTKRPNNFQAEVEQIERYARALRLNIPPVVFKGSFIRMASITRGILNPKLKESWDKNKSEFNSNPYETIKKTFLDFESSLGGKTEGVVLTNSSEKQYKFVQADQYDKNVRFARKAKYQSDKSEIEIEYWTNINKVSKHILKGLNYNLKNLSFEEILDEYHSKINKMTDTEIMKLFSSKFEAMRDEGKLE